MNKHEYLGIDVGASGIKGGIVDIKKGELITERFRLPTPNPAKPAAVAKVFNELVQHFEWKGKIIGCGFPSIIKKGVAHTAANIDQEWVGTNAEQLLSNATGCPVVVRNDADVAGIAEMKLGIGKDYQQDTVLIVTIGSGLGSALFTNGELVPNTEFGHFYLKGHNRIVEQFASDRVRKNRNLSWKNWALRFNKYLKMVEKLISPDLIILGGGSSKRFEKFEKYLTVEVPVKPAILLNKAGIIGAALHAKSMEKKIKKSFEPADN